MQRGPTVFGSIRAFGFTLALMALAFSLCHVLRTSGVLQPLELGAYDLFFSLSSGKASDARKDIVVIGHTEADETRYGTILPDGVLARLLNRIDDEAPLAVGLDLIRDRPEPPQETASSTSPLENVLRSTDNLVAIIKDSPPSFAAPPVLADRDDRLGAADIAGDSDGVVRRGLLFVTAKGKTRPTLAVQLATRRLQHDGVNYEWLDDRFRIGAATYHPLVPSRSGFYQDAALDGGYQFLLRYPACSSRFDRYRIEDILEGNSLPDLAGKIVLIGNMLELSKDLFVVPDHCGDLPGRRLFGVELHAQITAQLIDQATGVAPQLATTGQWIENLKTGLWLDNLWIGLWCALGVLAVMVVNRTLTLAIALTVALLGLLGVTYGLFAALGWWLPLIPPIIGFILALAMTSAFVAVVARFERDTLMELLSGVVSKRVADALWHQRSSRGENERAPPELMMATVMFTDIAGFTTISEQLPEPILANWLNEYLEAMVDIVAAHDGVIEKFAGDGLTIEFGPPDQRTTAEEIEADARNSLATALAMEARLDELNHSWSERGWPEIGIRIGIHTGQLMAGAVGGAARFQYSIIGDTANTASRLEAYGKDDPALQTNVGECRIFLSEVTRQYLEKDIDLEFVGRLKLRGKSDDVSVYRVVTPRMSKPAQEEERS